MNNDLISRQKALDMFEPWLKVQGYSEGELNMLKAVLYELKIMPSAQPEIIRCKDCIHMIINEKHQDKPMICCRTKMVGSTDPNWFCADAERRHDE